VKAETTGQLTALEGTTRADRGEARRVRAPETVVEIFRHAMQVKARPDVLNYKRGGAWHSLSSEELLSRIRHVALGLHALGLRRGDHAGILSESSPEWVVADLGCQFAGVINVPIYPTLAPPQVCYIMEDSGSLLLFVQDAAAYERVREALAACASLSTVVLMTGEAGGLAGVITLAELEARGAQLEVERPGLLDELSAAIGADDLTTIIYTSGTTGEPKGVMLTHSNVVSNLVATSERLAFTPEDVVLSVLPLSHVFERGAMYMYLHHGAKVFFSESMERIGDNMREVRPTLVVAVPRLFEKIYARIKDKAAEGGRVKTALLMWAVGVGKRWAHATVWKKPVSPLL
jgi:long-chain acyl-CoA synthetase